MALFEARQAGTYLAQVEPDSPISKDGIDLTPPISIKDNGTSGAVEISHLLAFDVPERTGLNIPTDGITFIDQNGKPIEIEKESEAEGPPSETKIKTYFDQSETVPEIIEGPFIIFDSRKEEIIFQG